MKIKILAAFAVATVVGVANADVLVPNGNFSAGDDGSWTVDGGVWGSSGSFTPTFEATGGSGDNGGYGQMEANGEVWAIFVNPAESPSVGGGIPVASLGIVPDGTTSYDFMIDLKTFAGTAGGGMKVEGYNDVNGSTFNTGDINFGAHADWTQELIPVVVPADTTKIVFVPLWGADSTIGYDNVGVAGVVPEPATLGLFGLAGGAMLFLRRRFRI
ncbi:PEP-CTERM sorting domain-containing protein [Pontiellaceae bacterium B1224]|nr:PEP-CTERM sorting domain-containing protein [Pontiellaceae bacterium B1224]